MRKTLIASIAVAGAAFGLLLLTHISRPSRPAGPSQITTPPPGNTMLLFEAEDASGIEHPFHRIEDVNAAGGAAIGVKETEAAEPSAASEARFDFDVKGDDRYLLWFRVWWKNGCGNSIYAAVDSSARVLVGNDGTYGVWHWIRGPAVALSPGRHTLHLSPREPGARLDQILLVTDEGYYPVGAIAELEATPEIHRPEGTPPAWISRGRRTRDPFIAAVGGAYQGGAEAFMLAAGIPYERLQEETITDPNVLGRYDLVWLSAPQVQAGPMWKALHTYVADGGTAIIEMMNRLKQQKSTSQYLELFAPAEMGVKYITKNISVSAAGSPLFEGIGNPTPFYDDVGCSRISGNLDGAGIETHGMLYRKGRAVGPALVKKDFGKGRLYVLAMPVSFMSMWRGTRFDGVGGRILLDAVGERYTPLYSGFVWNPSIRGKIHFADDFMREPGEYGQWRIEKGEFILSGPKPEESSFILQGSGTGWAATGYPVWDSYRISASVRAESGAGGVWLTTGDGNRVSLTLNGPANVLTLTQWRDSVPRNIRRETLPDPSAPWRRISLFQSKAAWQCFVDGAKIFSHKFESVVRGECGLIVLTGNASFDDVTVVDVDVLVEGTDKAIGEEGSPRCQSPFDFGVEPRTTYIPQWFLRPDPLGRHAFRVDLPTYSPSLLIMDGKALGMVGPDAEGPLVYLPDGEFPRRELDLMCPDWRDYLFGGQLVEWYSTGENWKHKRRWSCDKRWQWLGADVTEPSVLWYRRPLQPPYSISVLAAPAAEFKYNFERGGDLNLILSGNGKNVTEGVVIRVGPAGREGCTIRKNDELLGEARGFGLPDGHALHHRWFELKAVVEQTRIRFYYEGRLALDVTLSEPLQPGRVGFWTENNSVRIARATLSVSAENMQE